MLSAIKGTYLKWQVQKCNTMTYEIRLESNIKGCLSIIHSSSSTLNVSEVISTALLSQILDKHLSYHLLSPVPREENSPWDEVGPAAFLPKLQSG